MMRRVLAVAALVLVFGVAGWFGCDGIQRDDAIQAAKGPRR